MISSLTSPTLAKPLETFKDLLDHADELDFVTIKNTAPQQLMSTTSNKILRKIQNISDATGWNNATDITASVDLVITTPNKALFAIVIDFELRMNPLTGVGLGKIKMFWKLSSWVQQVMGI